MTVVYSFYRVVDGSLIVERLRDHVERALEVFDEDSRLVRYGRRFRQSFLELLRYAIVLHDFGKVPFNLAGRPTTFDGHEVLSAWFANEYLRQVEWSGAIEPIDREIVVLAVLLHHHPMDLRERAKKLVERGLCIDREAVKIFYEELRGMLDPHEIPLEKPVCAKEAIQEVLGSTVHIGLFGESWTDVWMNGGPAVRKAFLLLSQGVVAADYRSASLGRRGESTKFLEAVQVFLRHYGSASVRTLEPGAGGVRS